MYASFLGKTVGAKAVGEPERKQENGDLWNPLLRPRYSEILQEELLLLGVKINPSILFYYCLLVSQKLKGNLCTICINFDIWNKWSAAPVNNL